jgi:high affinity choline transporter 7
VAFTDVIQLICIFVGLWLGVIFGLINPHVTSLSETISVNPSWWPTCPAGDHCDYTSNATWIGDTPEYPGHYADALILMIFGGIPWQVYFQRVLSARTPAAAQLLSFAAAFGCLFAAIPAILIGAIARSADWTHPDINFPLSDLDNETHTYIPMEKSSMILPMVLQYLTPTPVAVIGLGAVSAAVMSSADSSILSISSMFANNIYQPIRNAIAPCVSGSITKGATGSEIVWVMRAMMVLSGAAAMYIAISVESIYKLFYLCSDLVFVVVFPQLLCVVYMKRVNTYGSVAAIIMGAIFRFTGRLHREIMSSSCDFAARW